jgi:ABC-type transport system involved in multi-copper enzyme maturation permease subunit
MLTVVWHTLRESIHRRMGLVLLIFSIVLPSAMFAIARFETQPDGSIFIRTGRFLHRDAAGFVNNALSNLLSFTAGPWLFLGMFAAAPLLVSYLEKGASDLLLSKGVPRWQFFFGRFLGVLAVLVVAIVLMDAGSALYLWTRTGIGPGRFLLALLFPLLSFVAYLALMALISLAQANAGVLIMVGFLQATFSTILFNRNQLFTFITWGWARTSLDWLYRILPKNFELDRRTSTYFATGNVEWWPIWSTAVFIAAALGLSFWLLHRKSF